MQQVRLTKVAIPTNRSVKAFSDERVYIATGDLIGNKINLDSAERVGFENKPSRANQETEPGEVIFAKMMATDKTLVINNSSREYIFSSGFFILRPTKEVLSDYLYYFLRSKSFHTQKDKNCSGATQKAITLGGLENVFIPLPSLEEQKIIVQKLDKISELIDLKKEAIEKTEALTKSVFLEMFGDPGFNLKKWGIEKLEHIVAPGKIVTYGIVQAGPNIENGIPYIRTGDIKNNQIIIEGLLRTSPEIARSYKRSEVSYGDIVMSIRATVGTAALLPPELHGANLTQGTARISPGPKIDKLFLFYLIQTRSVQDWLERSTKGATFKEITLTRLRELPIIVPSLDLQNKFAEFASKNQFAIENQKQSLQKIQSLYDVTAQKIFG